MNIDRCPTCDHWTRKGQEQLAEEHRKHPVYGTDFSQPLSALVEDVRNQLSHARGRLSDIRAAHPGLKDRLDPAEGALTCCISFLFNTLEELQKLEARAAATITAKNDDK